MPTLIETQRVYPQALRLGQKSRSYRHDLRALRTAVAELSSVNDKRALHVKTVANSVQAVMHDDARYFYKKLDPAIKQRDCQGSGLTPQTHESAYIEEIMNPPPLLAVVSHPSHNFF